MTDRRNDATLATKAPSTDGAAAGGIRVLGQGDQIGRYTIVRLLGRGGMGAVYEATDPELGRQVAIKILHEGRGEDERDALRREAQALATLVHQNVVMVYDVGIAREDVFLVMQLVEGETIDAWIARAKPDADTIVTKFRQAGAGLAGAHAAGLVHCDFKPANVLIDDEGTVRVGDFGLARQTTKRLTARGTNTEPTEMTTLAGTPAYMAPEQFTGLVTPASDQFAFCVALWECLAGERPFEDSSIATLDPGSRGPRRELPRSAKIPRRVRRVLERGMSEFPTDRFPTMTSLLAALEPRRRAPYVIAALGAVAIAGGVTLYAKTRAVEIDPNEIADLDNQLTLTNLGTTGCAYAPMVTPSGEVIYDSTRGDVVDLYAVPLAGGTSRQLTSGPHWEWRAQRGRGPGEISYLVHPLDKPEDSHIDYLDLATGKSTTVVNARSWDAITVGDRLFYSPADTDGIRVKQHGVEKPFATPPAGSAYLNLTASYAGDRLAVTQFASNGASNGIACTIDLTALKVDVACHEDLVTPTRPAFGRDSHVLYVATLDGIVRRDLRTNVTTKISPEFAEGGLAVTPDGDALIYSACIIHTAIRLAADKTPIHEDRDVAHPAIASNGSIAWVRTVNDVQVLMLRDPQGRISQLTTVEDGSVAYPRFSQNGELLVFGMEKAKTGLHTIELAKPGSLRRVTKIANDFAPHWVDDKLIAFAQLETGGGARVFIVKPDGAGRTEISTASRFLYGSRGNELLLGSSQGTLWFDLTTRTERPGPPRPPGGEPLAATTSPSGEWIVYQMGEATVELYRARTDGSSAPEKVGNFDSSWYVNRPAISDDGKVIVTAGQMYGDLVKIPANPGSHF